MKRRIFISNVGKLVLGALGAPVLGPYLKVKTLPSGYWTLLKSISPVAKRFLQNIIIDGVEEYATDKLKDWLDSSLGFGKVKEKEISKFPTAIQNNHVTINGEDIEVYMGIDEQSRPSISIFPLLEVNDESNVQKLLKHSHIPMFKKNSYLDCPNFPELVGLDELANYYNRDENLGKKRIIYLRDALLPSSFNTRTFFSVPTENGVIGSSVFKTLKGDIHIIYEIDKDMKVVGEITFSADDVYGKIPSVTRGFMHDFSKEEQ